MLTSVGCCCFCSGARKKRRLFFLNQILMNKFFFRSGFSEMTAEEVSDKEPIFPGKKPKRPKKKEEKIKPIKKKLPKTKIFLLFRKCQTNKLGWHFCTGPILSEFEPTGIKINISPKFCCFRKSRWIIEQTISLWGENSRNDKNRFFSRNWKW